MAPEQLRIAHLFCERDERVLFDNLNFTVSSGDVVRIEGQNGSGKTTLLRMLTVPYPIIMKAIFSGGDQLLAECAEEFRQSVCCISVIRPQ